MGCQIVRGYQPFHDGGGQITVKEQTELLWAVVKVESGIPVIIEAYRDGQSAEMREQSLRKDMHPENDETGVFEIQEEIIKDGIKLEEQRAEVVRYWWSKTEDSLVSARCE